MAVKRVGQRKSRKFNGVTHKTTGLVYTKGKAAKVAAKSRKAGTKTRVVRLGKKNEYNVYYGPHSKK